MKNWRVGEKIYAAGVDGGKRRAAETEIEVVVVGYGGVIWTSRPGEEEGGSRSGSGSGSAGIGVGGQGSS